MSVILDSFRGGFSGADIRALVQIPRATTPYELGTLSQLSIQSHRDKFPVTGLGRQHVRGFTRGHRTVAGTLCFSSLDRHGLTRVAETLSPASSGSLILEVLQLDELPPFDITVVMVNEYGEAQFTGLLGVEVLDSGVNLTIDDLALNTTYSYMAQRWVPLQPLGHSTPEAALQRGVFATSGLGR